MVRVLRVSTMPMDVLVWVRPIKGGGHIVYLSDEWFETGARGDEGPWKFQGPGWKDR